MDNETKEKKGKLYLAGLWGHVIEEAVKHELSHGGTACGDIIDVMSSPGLTNFIINFPLKKHDSYPSNFCNLNCCLNMSALRTSSEI